MINDKQSKFLALSVDSFSFNIDFSITAIHVFKIKLNLKHTYILPDFPMTSANCLFSFFPIKDWRNSGSLTDLSSNMQVTKAGTRG